MVGNVRRFNSRKLHSITVGFWIIFHVIPDIERSWCNSRHICGVQNVSLEKVKGPIRADLLNLEASHLGRPLPHQLMVTAPAGANHMTPEAGELLKRRASS